MMSLGPPVPFDDEGGFSDEPPLGKLAPLGGREVREATSGGTASTKARPSISFCILPPESERACVSSPPPRTSNSRTMRAACACAAWRLTTPKLEKAGLRKRSDTAFSHTFKSPTRPTPCRSSGMRATPCVTSQAGDAFKAAPSKLTLPRVATRVPHNSSASASCPLPETPAIAVISPAFKFSDTPFSRSCLPPAVYTPSIVQTAWPTDAAGRRCAVVTLRPTIHCASCACVVSTAAASATSLPPRSTATRCDTRSTSPSLWLMKIIDRPPLTICPSVSNSASLSCGVSTAVGSSRIRMRAPRYSAFRISTRWRSPTDSLPTCASGDTARPKRCATSISFARAALRREKSCHSDSLPIITLSSTLKLSASVKCWCTMPMPAASAALGLPGGKGLPKTSIWPASAV